jgi:hypothetical protein
MLAQPDAIRALDLRWFRSNVHERRALCVARRTHMFFFSRGKRLGRATGWHGLGHCQAAVAAAWEKIGKFRAVGLKKADSVDSGKSSTD